MSENNLQVIQESNVAAAQPARLRGMLTLLIFLAIMGVAAMWVVVRGIDSRLKSAAAVRQETLDLAVPTVAVMHPKRGVQKDEVVVPGNIQAFTEAPIFARTSGYLTKWYTDIGTRVKTGQLLAEIETPEIDRQLDQTRADLATAEANLRLAEITAARYQALLKKDAISRQETDQAISDSQAKKAIVESARANVKRLEDLVSYEKVYASFDGVITARNTDIGALVNAGNSGQALFRLAATDKLRVYVNVPQIYSRSVVPGVTADLTVAEFAGRTFTGQVVRTAGVIDAASRTLLTEIDVDNKGGQLKPGDYAEVHLKLPAKAAALIVPVTALIFRGNGLQVGVVRESGSEGGKVELLPITSGRDYGNEIEITSGISEQDEIIINPPDSLTSGSRVRIASATSAHN